MKRICVFCGSKKGVHPDFVESAVSLGKLLAQKKIGLVYGGAKIGLMGVVANTVLQHGGEVIGVLPEFLTGREVAHEGIGDLRIVSSMHERKALMSQLSDGFIALPGGLGTFEEFFEMLTWSQLGLHKKPVGLLNVQNYFSPILQLIDRGIEENFIAEKHRQLLLVSDKADKLLTDFENYHPIDVTEWISKTSET